MTERSIITGSSRVPQAVSFLSLPGKSNRTSLVDTAAKTLDIADRPADHYAAKPLDRKRVRQLVTEAAPGEKKRGFFGRIKKALWNRHVAKASVVVVGGAAAATLYACVPIARYAVTFFVDPIIMATKDAVMGAWSVKNLNKEIGELREARKEAGLGDVDKQRLKGRVKALKNHRKHAGFTIAASAFRIAATIASLGVFDVIASCGEAVAEGFKFRAKILDLKREAAAANGEDIKPKTTWKEKLSIVAKVINELAPTILICAGAIGTALIFAGVITASGPAGVAIGAIGLAGVIWAVSNDCVDWVMA